MTGRQSTLAPLSHPLRRCRDKVSAQIFRQPRKRHFFQYPSRPFSAVPASPNVIPVCAEMTGKTDDDLEKTLPENLCRHHYKSRSQKKL